jgi:hypothetical protein
VTDVILGNTAGLLLVTGLLSGSKCGFINE